MVLFQLANVTLFSFLLDDQSLEVGSRVFVNVIWALTKL